MSWIWSQLLVPLEVNNNHDFFSFGGGVGGKKEIILKAKEKQASQDSAC